MPQRVTVNEKTGVQILNPVIEDKFGLFYRANGLKRINLPEGDYNIQGQFKFIKPLNYRLPILPMREKLYVVPDISDIEIVTVPNLEYKAQVDIHLRLIQFNKEFFDNATSPEFFCVAFHELGHFRYYTEYKCDIYAIKKMLEIGFNPSQFMSFLSILKHSEDRKEIAIRTAKNSDNEGNNPNNSSRNWLSYLFAR